MENEVWTSVGYYDTNFYIMMLEETSYCDFYIMMLEETSYCDFYIMMLEETSYCERVVEWDIKRYSISIGPI